MVAKSLGPYQIVEALGAGGMGEVYLAEDTRLGRKVALKILPTEFSANPDWLARFEQEARAAAALNHPHIAAIRWLAYVADVTGTHEVWLRSLANLGLARQVSQGGGAEPAWSPDGDELFFRSNDDGFMAVPVGGGNSIELGRPIRLFDDTYFRDPFLNTGYGVAEDGRFLMTEVIERPAIEYVQVFQGFAEEVHRLVTAAQ